MTLPGGGPGRRAPRCVHSASQALDRVARPTGRGRASMSAGFEIVLSGGLDAPRAARRAIAEQHPALPQQARYDLELLVTELVTNAVRHGGADEDRPLKLECRAHKGRIRVEVIDPGADCDSPPRPGNGAGNGGWRLLLLDRIAESWGVRPAPAGTCVWFEMPPGATA